MKTMNILYQSTRSNMEAIPASQAILQGLSSDGGLFVPITIPKLESTVEEFSQMDYRQCAYEVMKLLLTDFTEEELKTCINKAYDDKFDTKEIAPLIKQGNGYYLELFHGPTLAFKDMALSILPHLLITSAKKNNIKEEIVILTATSGDTGKAALEGFTDVEGTKIIVFYPKNGVSAIQEKQMITQKGENTYVVGITGNFDQAQTGVKNIFNNRELEKGLKDKGYIFSSANSINIGRLVPQIVYYVYSYAQLYKEGQIKKDEKINVVVPTGNFGNILAGYYAKCMGLPIDKLICASNENKVLFDFFNTGIYDKNREFILTSSPSMDILISSNLERLIFQLTGKDYKKTLEFMNDLSAGGKYEITGQMKEQMENIVAGYASEEETAKVIKEIFEETGYVIDTHTAVAASVYEKYLKDTGDDKKTVITSTASPYKFPVSVMEAIGTKYKGIGDFDLVKELSNLTGLEVPKAIAGLETADVIHDVICKPEEMEALVKEILK